MSDTNSALGDDPEDVYEENRISPEDVNDYRQSDGEYDEMLAVSVARLEGTDLSANPDAFSIEDMPEIRICGPTGCGKTTAAQNLAVDLERVVQLQEEGYPVLSREGMLEEAENRGADLDLSDGAGYAETLRTVHAFECGELESGIPYFDVTMSHATNSADLLGHPSIDEGDTEFTEGTVTKAVRSSQVGPVVLLLDEVNRAPTAAKDELYDALDHRAKVTLEGLRGGETVNGNNLNLLGVSTMNKGQGHHVEPIDTAEKRRLGGMWETTYLGFNPNEGEPNDPDPEVDLIVDRTPVSRTVAEHMVRAANDVREQAQSEEMVRYGVPTSNLLDWARTAFAFHQAGIDNPVMRAADSTVSRAIYDHNEDEVDTVSTTLSSVVGSMPFHAEDDSAWTNDGDAFYCTEDDCNFTAPEDEVDDDTKVFLYCPECDGNLQTRD